MTTPEGKMIDRALLKACCSTDKERPHLGDSFSAVLPDGRGFDCATNGTCLLALDGATLASGGSRTPDVGFLLASPRSSVGAALATFREWVGVNPELPVEAPCRTCHGTGKEGCRICHGMGSHRCRDCDDDHDCGQCNGSGSFKCDTCDGKKWHAPKQTPRIGYIDAVAVDRCLIAGVLDGFEDERIAIALGGELAPITIDGNGWRFVVMPIRVTDTDGAEAAPVLNLTR